jgi:hypothetical protein
MGFPFLDIIGLGTKIIDKVIPDPAQKAAAQLELLKLQQSGELDKLKTEMSVLLAEAQSQDKWTSRARPSFLYLCYFLIGFGVPMGIVSAISPNTAVNIANGFGGWLKAIPEIFYDMMTWVMSGYILGRSAEKIQKIRKGK